MLWGGTFIGGFRNRRSRHEILWDAAVDDFSFRLFFLHRVLSLQVMLHVQPMPIVTSAAIALRVIACHRLGMMKVMVSDAC